MHVTRITKKSKSSGKKYRFVKGKGTNAPRKRNVTSGSSRKAPSRTSTPSKNTMKNTAKNSRTKRATQAQRADVLATPGWADLKKATNGRVRSSITDSGILATLSTVRCSLAILVVASLFTLYVGHVQATQEVVNDVYQARKENIDLNLNLNLLQGQRDSATGPAVIYERAKALGLREYADTAEPIYVDKLKH